MYSIQTHWFGHWYKYIYIYHDADLFLSMLKCIAEQQPRVRGWLLGSVDGKKTGLVPANYVKILGRRRGRKEAVQISRSATTTSAPARPATISNLEEIATDFAQPSPAQYSAADFEQSFSQVGPSTTEQAVFENSFPATGPTGQPSQSAFKEATDILDETNLIPK